VVIFCFAFSFLFSQSNKESKGNLFKLVRLKYSGGGDWYNDPSAEQNMMEYLKKNTNIETDIPAFYTVDVASNEIFNYF
jgi:hypothetical protein